MYQKVGGTPVLQGALSAARERRPSDRPLVRPRRAARGLARLAPPFSRGRRHDAHGTPQAWTGPAPPQR